MGAQLAQLGPLDVKMILAIGVVLAGTLLTFASQLGDDSSSSSSQNGAWYLFGMGMTLISTAISAACSVVEELVLKDHRQLDPLQFGVAMSIFGTLQNTIALLAAQIIPGNDHGVQVWSGPAPKHRA